MEKINWMLGMTDNMMNMTMKNPNDPMCKEMYMMTSSMMGNLNHMKLIQNKDMIIVSMMETMMRNMESMMMKMNMDNQTEKMMMSSMMKYMIIMQMSYITSMISK